VIQGESLHASVKNRDGNLMLSNSCLTPSRSILPRFVFFASTEGRESSSFGTLVKSDRRAVQSVASVLRLDMEEAEETILDVIIDREN
jgi:hypothetical protein